MLDGIGDFALDAFDRGQLGAIRRTDRQNASARRIAVQVHGASAAKAAATAVLCSSKLEMIAQDPEQRGGWINAIDFPLLSIDAETKHAPILTAPSAPRDIPLTAIPLSSMKTRPRTVLDLKIVWRAACVEGLGFWLAFALSFYSEFGLTLALVAGLLLSAFLSSMVWLTSVLGLSLLGARLRFPLLAWALISLLRWLVWVGPVYGLYGESVEIFKRPEIVAISVMATVLGAAVYFRAWKARYGVALA